MTTQTLQHNAKNTAPAAAALRSRAAAPRKTYAWLIGALFLAGFLTYGVGFGMINSVITVPNFLATVGAHQTTLVLGAFLMLLNTVVDVGKGVLFFPILQHHGQRTALVYLSALIVQVVFLDIGALSLLMLAPLGQYAVEVGAASAAWATGLGSLLIEGNNLAYHIGQATLCFGGIFLCALLYRARLIPRFLAGWGFIGYILHLAGALAELFGMPISYALLIPGALFEVLVAFWLIFTGVQNQVQPHGEPTAVVGAA